MPWFVVTTVKSFRLREKPETFPLQLEQDIFVIEAEDKALAAQQINVMQIEEANVISDSLQIDDKPAFVRHEGIRSIHKFGDSIPGFADTVAFDLLRIKDQQALENLLDSDKSELVTYLAAHHHCDWLALEEINIRKDAFVQDGGDWFASHQYYRLDPVGQSSKENILILESVKLLCNLSNEDFYVTAEKQCVKSLDLQLDGCPYKAVFVGFRKLTTICNPFGVRGPSTHPPVSKTEITYSDLEVDCPDQLNRFMTGKEAEVWSLNPTHSEAQ